MARLERREPVDLGVSDLVDQAARALVVAPAGLVTQWHDKWQEELERKFGLPTVIAGRDS